MGGVIKSHQEVITVTLLQKREYIIVKYTIDGFHCNKKVFMLKCILENQKKIRRKAHVTIDV